MNSLICWEVKSGWGMAVAVGLGLIVGFIVGLTVGVAVGISVGLGVGIISTVSPKTCVSFFLLHKRFMISLIKNFFLTTSFYTCIMNGYS